MSFDPNSPAIRTAIARGLIPAPPKPKKAGKPELVAPGFVPPGTWTVPVHVVSGDNQSALSRGKIGRAGHERRAVYRVLARQHREFAPFADAAQAGRPVVVVLTRLGGREMDTDGLQAACKYVRDAVADFLGVGDGPRGPVAWWYAQEPGSGPVGVRVEIEAGG